MAKNGIPLCALPPGRGGVITAMRVQDALSARLLDMGFTPGARVFVLRAAPPGDPLIVRLRGYDMVLRKSEAARVLVRARDEA